MGGRVSPDDLDTHTFSEASAPELEPKSDSCLGPLEPLPRLSHREARLASRLARISAEGGIDRSLAWLSEALGTPIEAGRPPRTTQTMIVRLDTGDAVASNFLVQIFYP